MATQPANYPSPTQQHASPAYGPFYGTHQQHNAPQTAPGASQEMPEDARLRNALAPMANQPSPQQQQQLPPPPPPPPQQQQQQQQQTREHEHQHQQHQQQHDHTEAADLQARHYNAPPINDGYADQGSIRTQGQVGQSGSSPTVGHQQLGPDASAQRDRRSKVSRACDECRRKKIRCDAPDESGQTPCSSCRRTGAPCAFSRQPMKRGPSKGYIKELAERLNALEGQIHPHHGQQTNAELQFLQQQLAEAAAGAPRRDTEVFTNASTPDHHGGRKRTHSQSEVFIDAPTQQNRPAPYGNTYHESTRPSPYPTTPAQQAPTAHMQPPPPSEYRQPNPSHASQQPFFKYGGDTGRRESVSTPYDGESSTGASTLVDWNEEVVDDYYRSIHQTFPLLPHSKNRLRKHLGDCSVSLRESFLTVLECTMRTFPTQSSSNLRANHTYAPMMKRAAELLSSYPFENPSTHTSTTNLVYLQTLLLMALESDNHGPATVRGQAGPSRSEWLGRAAGVAGQLEINLVRPRERFVTEGDPDSEERLSRRVWWVLFILDRWHASSTADLLKLPENSVVLLPEDQILLGESTYHLARLSFIIGHLAAILTTTKTPETNVMSPSNPASALLGLTLAGEIDRFRESVESVWGSLNLVHLCYHHCHLLIKRLNPTTEPTELIGHAVKVATVLNQRQTPITPLNHHFAALSAMTLCELVDIDKTHAEAIRGIEQISEALGLGRGLAGHEHSSGWDSAIRELVLEKKAKLVQVLGIDALPPGLARLQGPAGSESGEQQQQQRGGPERQTPNSLEGNVSATSVVGGDGRRGKFDPTMLTRYGYLTALGQGMFNVK